MKPFKRKQNFPKCSFRMLCLNRKVDFSKNKNKIIVEPIAEKLLFLIPICHLTHWIRIC